MKKKILIACGIALFTAGIAYAMMSRSNTANNSCCAPTTTAATCTPEQLETCKKVCTPEELEACKKTCTPEEMKQCTPAQCAK